MDQAREMYRTGMKLIEIAKAFDLPEGTIRSWKNRQKWESNVAKGESNVAKRKATPKKQAVVKEVEQVIENPDLTDRQRLFCLIYVRCFNATKAAIKAGYSRETAAEQGYQLLRKPSVRDEIARLKQNRLNREMLDEHDIFQRYMDIAFSDITDFVTFGREEVQVMGAFGPVEVKDPETGERMPLKKSVNTIKFREADEVDGTLIAEIKQGRDGASIKLMDRLKALDWLADHMDLATEEQRAKVAQLRAQTQKITGEGMEVEDMTEIERELYGEGS